MLYTIAAFSDDREADSANNYKEIEDNVFGRIFGGMAVKRFEGNNAEDALNNAFYYFYDFLLKSIENSEKKVSYINNGKNTPIIIVHSGSFNQIIRFGVYKDEKRTSRIYKNFNSDEMSEILNAEKIQEEHLNKKIEAAKKYKIFLLSVNRGMVLNSSFDNNWYILNVSVSSPDVNTANIKLASEIVTRLKRVSLITANIFIDSLEYFEYRDGKFDFSVKPEYENIQGFCIKYRTKHQQAQSYEKYVLYGRAVEYNVRREK